jgi:hypothetical protein
MVDMRMEDETVWLSLNQISALYQRDKSVISRHIKNIFAEGELEERATVANYATVQNEGDRNVERMVTYYNLGVIISVGYRVKYTINHEPMYMRDWLPQVDDFAERYGKGILQNAGTVSRQAAIEKAIDEYKKYHRRIADLPSPVERDYLEAIKQTQKKLKGKTGGERE